MVINIYGLNIHFKRYLNSSGRLNTGQSAVKNLLLIHGFTGSSLDWEKIVPKLPENFNYFTIDLLGHGNSDSPSEKNLYNAESLTSQLKEFSAKIIKEKFVLLGYSMGGRAALSFSVKYPEDIKGLILESTSAGIKEEMERKERIKKDEQVAEFIDSHSIEEFIEYWMGMDIFNTQKRFSNSKLGEIKRTKLKNSKTGLSNSLRGFGTGCMTPLYDKLKNITCKTLLITGDLDEKFSLLNAEMVNSFPAAKHISIKNSGHNTHLETPDAFIKTVNKFLAEFN
jgi:2-succinyl-6-hydroxy-2,4-cyclohexadiene-1-carboxylate synthase